MIHFLTGENTFEVARATQAIVDAWVAEIVQNNAGLTSQPERVDGSELHVRDLPDLLTATTLFAQHRLVIVKGLSENTAAWNALPALLPRVSDDITLVIVEVKPDKRLTVFKTLKAAAQYQEFVAWTERDTAKAEAWVQREVARLGVKLSKQLVRRVVERVGVDQWQLAQALEKLDLVAGDSEVTEDLVVNTIEARPSENVFNLFETALRGDARRLHDAIATLELVEDPYKLFALLSSQVFQLAAIQASEKGDSPASDLGIHPFVVSKLSSHARSIPRGVMRRIVAAFAQADADMKSSRGEPWLLIEKALLEVAR